MSDMSRVVHIRIRRLPWGVVTTTYLIRATGACISHYLIIRGPRDREISVPIGAHIIWDDSPAMTNTRNKTP
jgi:hypothetical protein